MSDGAQLAQLIKEYAAAKVDESWKGTAPPEYRERYVEDVRQCRERLENFVAMEFGVTIKIKG